MTRGRYLLPICCVCLGRGRGGSRVSDSPRPGPPTLRGYSARPGRTRGNKQMGLAVTRGPRGAGRETCPGTRGAVQRPSARAPAPSPRTLPPLRCRGRGGHSGLFFRAWGAALAPPLLWRPRLAAAGSRRTHTGGRGGRSAACPAEALEFEALGRRPCMRPQACPKRVRARPRAEKQRRLQSRFQAASSALTQPSLCPASPAQALAAEQHGELRLALGMSDVRRRSPRIGQVGGACKE